MMDDLDKILKAIMDQKYPPGNATEGKDCISEERFAEYLADLLGTAERGAVENHFIQCEACFQKSIVFSKVIDDMQSREMIDVPEEVIEKTKTLVREETPKDMIAVVLEFGENIIRIIKDTANICTIPEPAVLSVKSGDTPSKGPGMAELSSVFNEIKADISVEKINNAECEIQATLSGAESGKLLDDIRINLISGGRELASYLTVKGHASFRNLLFDTYTLTIYKGNTFIGLMKIKLLIGQ
jgi:hypothetical protein